MFNRFVIYQYRGEEWATETIHLYNNLCRSKQKLLLNMPWLSSSQQFEDSDDEFRSYDSDASEETVAGPSNPRPILYNHPSASLRAPPEENNRYINAVLPGQRRRLPHPNDPVPGEQVAGANPSLLTLPLYPGTPSPPPPDSPGPPPYDPPPYPGGPAGGGGAGPGQAGVQYNADALAREANLEADFMKNWFDRSRRRFTFEGKIGHGITGVVCQVKQRRSLFRGLSSRRFVVKRAIYRFQEHYLTNEILNLKDFYGAQHIVQPFTVHKSYKNPLRGVSGPTLWMELIENGSLLDLVKRANGRQLPNRLLFRFFLCLIQFCIAMAWPPRGSKEGPVRREKIPTDAFRRNNKYQLRHADMKLKNILIGSLDLNDDIHNVIPILKLIDFHRAQLFNHEGHDNLGVKWNIFDIGMVMHSLITGDTAMHPPVGEAIIPGPNGLRVIQSFGADITPQAYPNLDPDLRTIVVQCIPDHMDNMISLEDLYAKVSGIIQTRSSEYYSQYATAHLETTRMMKYIIKSLIFDADF
ncbi:kinase-like domain-containing protein [Biscogniauxia sp. FL1348]|nr:kinase-like domain-containing protein [Biscogniauxia sp. FL1348]